MQVTKRLIAILLTLLLSAPAALAQELQRPQPTPEVQILLQPEQVRFTAPPTVEQMRLQIYAANGELVFDSQPLAVSQLTWLWLGTDGQPVKSGLYAYTLTIKTAGAAAERVRRGHFIVDRAHERDAQADRVWLTSQTESGNGTEVTVAHNEGSVLAGARTVSERPSVTGRETEPRKVEEEQAAPAVKPNLKAAAAQAGTVGRLAKFTTATEVGDSVITEQNSRIGVGTGTPSHRLAVVGGPAWTIHSWGGALELDNASAIAWRANTSDVKFGIGRTESGLFFFRTNSPLGSTASHPTYDFKLDNAGNVGLGNVDLNTNLSGAKLNLFTGSGSYGLAHTDGAVTVGSYVNVAGGWLGTRSNHALHFFTNNSNPHVTLTTGGNVGIGTTIPDPNRKLDIVGGGATAAGIKSTNDRAFLSLTSAINGQTRTWSVESGVYGQQDNFGIYNWQTGKAVVVEPNGTLIATSLRIAGGADFAEHFDVNSPRASKTAAAPKIEAGLIVSIDPAHPGKLSLSRRAYDRRVAGIISGAGGVSPGVMMGQQGTLADGQHPVALSGRVYVWADATRGAIKPGDLLTTSATPGHAMKALNPARAQGAVIGKAMTGLKSGKGLVLALVTLQ